MKKNLFFKILVNVITTSRLLFSFFLLPLIPKLDKYIFLFKYTIHKELIFKN